MVVLPGPRDGLRNRTHDDLVVLGEALDGTVARTRVERRLFPGNLCVGPLARPESFPAPGRQSQDDNGVSG